MAVLLIPSGRICGIELSRSAAGVWLGAYCDLSVLEGRRNGERVAALRASPRPLAGVLGCLTAACAPAVIVPSSQRAVFSGVVKNERSFRYDPATKANAGGSPDSQLLTQYRRRLHSQSRRVCQTLRQIPGIAWPGGDPRISTVPDQKERSLALRLHPDGLRAPLSILQHAPLFRQHRPYPVAPVREETSRDFKSRRSSTSVGGTEESLSPDDSDHHVCRWPEGVRSGQAQGV